MNNSAIQKKKKKGRKKISKIILCFVSTLEKYLQSNQYQDLLFDIRHIKKKNICLFSILVKFDFGFFINHDETDCVTEQFRKKEWI